MKLFKILLIIVFILLAVSTALYFIVKSVPDKNPPKPIFLAEVGKCDGSIDKRFCGKLLQRAFGIGSSMEPTMSDGDGTYNEYKVKAEVNDIVSFYCTKPDCYEGATHKGSMVKRLVKIRDDGAWWVEGDNKSTSFDSRHFGWLLPSDTADEWVVDPQSIK